MIRIRPDGIQAIVVRWREGATMRVGLLVLMAALPLAACATPAVVGTIEPATPDIGGTLVATVQPRIYGTYLSPDGEWRAEVITRQILHWARGFARLATHAFAGIGNAQF
jgi:hypothetical protein